MSAERPWRYAFVVIALHLLQWCSAEGDTDKIKAVLASMSESKPDNTQVQAKGCEELKTLAATEANQVQIAEYGGISPIVAALNANKNDADLQKQCTGALEKLSFNEANGIQISVFGGIQAILDAMNEHSADGTLQTIALGALENLALNKANQDTIAGLGGIQAVVAAMNGHSTDATLQRKGCGTLRNLASTHDANKVKVGSVGGIEVILAAMNAHRADAKLQLVAMGVLWTLTIDEANSIKIGSMLGGVEAIVAGMKAHPGNAEVLKQGCRVLQVLAMYKQDGGNRVKIAELGGIEAILVAMTGHTENYDLQTIGVAALRNIAANAENQVKIVEVGGIEAIVSAMNGHRDVDLQAACLNALRNIAANGPVVSMAEKGTVEAVLAAMKDYMANSELLRGGCGVLQNLAASNSKKIQIVELGGIEVILEAMVMHSEDKGLQEAACGALWNLSTMNDANPAKIAELGGAAWWASVEGFVQESEFNYYYHDQPFDPFADGCGIPVYPQPTTVAPQTDSEDGVGIIAIIIGVPAVVVSFCILGFYLKRIKAKIGDLNHSISQLMGKGVTLELNGGPRKGTIKFSQKDVQGLNKSLQEAKADAAKIMEETHFPETQYIAPHKIECAANLMFLLNRKVPELILDKEQGGNLMNELLDAGLLYIQNFVKQAEKHWTKELLEAINKGANAHLYEQAYRSILDVIKDREAKDMIKYTERVQEQKKKPKETYENILENSEPDPLKRLISSYIIADRFYREFMVPLMEYIKEEAEKDPDTGVKKLITAPMKGFSRVLEKLILRPNGGLPWDTVRAMIVCKDMRAIDQVLEYLLGYKGIVIFEINDRFNDNKNGWADCALYITSADPSYKQTVGEIQIVHSEMLNVRKNLGANDKYDDLRFGSELLRQWHNPPKTGCMEPWAAKKSAADPAAEPKLGAAADPAADPATGLRSAADPAAEPQLGATADPAADPATGLRSAADPAAEPQLDATIGSATGLRFAADPAADPVCPDPS